MEDYGEAAKIIKMRKAISQKFIMKKHKVECLISVLAWTASSIKILFEQSVDFICWFVLWLA